MDLHVLTHSFPTRRSSDLDRAKEGAGPVTLSADLGYLKLVLTHAAAVHGVDVKVEPVDLARVALKRLGLISKSRHRDRRPTHDEIRIGRASCRDRVCQDGSFSVVGVHLHKKIPNVIE